MSYKEDNKDFLGFIDSVYKLIKGTKYKMYISIDEPDVRWDENNPHPDWMEYDAYDKNEEFKGHTCHSEGWGQKIMIFNPEVQKPYWYSENSCNYKYPLIEICQNYEDYDQYYICRNAAHMYDAIDFGSTTDDHDYCEKYISKSNIKNYIKKDLLNDLEVLSDASKKLAELRDSIKLAPLKFRKARD